MTGIEELQARIGELERENALLRRTIEHHKRQVRAFTGTDEERRLRKKIAEWEGSTVLINGGYYHGDRFIRPYVDRDQD